MRIQVFRRFAIHVLFAWLLALAAGIVNACVVQLEFGPGTGRMARAVVSMTQGHEAAHDAGADKHGAASPNIPCQRFCDEPSAVAQAVKQQSDPFSGFLLAAATAPALTSLLPRGAPPGFGLRRIRSGESIPIPIAFLRLAL